MKKILQILLIAGLIILLSILDAILFNPDIAQKDWKINFIYLLTIKSLKMAKTKPQTEQITTLKSWEEVDGSLKAIAVITAKEMALEAEMNDNLQKVQQKYQPNIDRLKAEKIGLERDIQLYCEDKKDMFDETRSYNLNYGKVGFRLGTGALKTLKGITWEAAKSLIKSSKKWRESFLRVKEEIDKNAIQSSGLTKEQLAKLGVYVHQEDTFYYEAFLKRSNEMPQEAGG